MKNKTLLFFLLCAVSSYTFSTDHVWIDDPSKIKWQQYSDGKFYFRNLNEFPGGAYQNNFGGCCTKYWIDASTEGGKALLSTFLYHMASNRPFYISKGSAAVDGPIQNVGVW